MFNSPILDLIILLSFTYFIGSLILSTVNEFIASIFKMRQKNLRTALQNLFFDKKDAVTGTSADAKKDDTTNNWKLFVQQKLLKSPHILSLLKQNKDYPDGKEYKNYPSYIPASNFVYAIIDVIGSDKFPARDLATLQTTIESSSLPPSLKKVLRDFAAKTQNDFDKFQKEIENFYNNAMERAGGWYKRRIRTVLLIISAVIATALNIDTLKIINNSLKDKDNLSKTVDNISNEMTKVALNNNTVTIKDDKGKTVLQVGTTTNKSSGDTEQTEHAVNADTPKKTVPKKDTAKADTTNTHPPVPIKPADAIKNLQIIYKQNTGYQFGYNGAFLQEWGFAKDFSFVDFIKKIFGIIITMFALQLGANYWFGIVDNAIKIRASGKKPDEKNN